jgi:hypothetical protein
MVGAVSVMVMVALGSFSAVTRTMAEGEARDQAGNG